MIHLFFNKPPPVCDLWIDSKPASYFVELQQIAIVQFTILFIKTSWNQFVHGIVQTVLGKLLKCKIVLLNTIVNNIVFELVEKSDSAVESQMGTVSLFH